MRNIDFMFWRMCARKRERVGICISGLLTSVVLWGGGLIYLILFVCLFVGEHFFSFYVCLFEFSFKNISIVYLNALFTLILYLKM